MQQRPNMPQGLATKVYDVLIEECGASDDALARASFVHEFERCTREAGPTNEYRVQGYLGFGGKFRYPNLTVDCYPEDETEDTRRRTAAANARLATLRDELQAAIDQAKQTPSGWRP